jgi:hypothetical protein
MDLVRHVDPEFSDSFYGDRVILNSGLTFGSTPAFLFLYSVLLPLGKAVDQGELNYAHHRGLFLRAGLNLTVTHPGDYLLSVRGGQFLVEPDSDGLFRLKGTDVAPAAIHQYDRICPVVRGLKRSCARMWFDAAPFPESTAFSQDCSKTYTGKVREIVTIDRAKQMAQRVHAKLPAVLTRWLPGLERE